MKKTKNLENELKKLIFSLSLKKKSEIINLRKYYPTFVKQLLSDISEHQLESELNVNGIHSVQTRENNGLKVVTRSVPKVILIFGCLENVNNLKNVCWLIKN